jgi:beta-lactamase class D
LFRGYRGCFVLRDVATGRVVARFGPARSAKRFIPCSTSKVASSLIFLETGTVSGPDQLLKWDGTRSGNPDWDRDLTLRDALRTSANWPFQQLAAKVGAEKMRHYFAAMGFGNGDLSGGVTGFDHSSLRISADEQTEFLARLQQGRVAPFSAKNQATVREMMRQPASAAPGSRAVVRGKTGTDGNSKTGIDTLGWFVGTVEKNGRAWSFAVNIDGNGKPSRRGRPLSYTARAIAYDLLKREGAL